MPVPVIDLYLYGGHEVATWAPLFAALRRRGADVAFVLEPPGRNVAKGSTPDRSAGWRDDKAGRLSPLVDEDTHLRLQQQLMQLGLPWIDVARHGADAVVTTQGRGWFDAYRGLKVRTSYGVGAVRDSWGHGEINKGMDLVLAHGPFSRLAIADRVPLDRVHAVGFPKWAPFLRGEITRPSARAELGIEPDGRPVVAYLPTWAHHSSLDAAVAAINELGSTTTVVMKPHHNNIHFEGDRLEGLDRNAVRVVDHAVSLVPFVAAADVVIADVRSGSFTEALLADRPVVAYVPPTGRSAANLVHGVDEATVMCFEPGDLRIAVERAMAEDRSAARRRWARWFFSAHENRDDEAAADVLLRSLDRTARSVGFDVRPRIDIDRVLEELASPPRPADESELVLRALWADWPGDPRLMDTVGALAPHLPIDLVVAWSERLRLADAADRCVLRQEAQRSDAAALWRAVCGAVAGFRHLDEAAVAAAIDAAGAVPVDEIGELASLLADLVSESLPAMLTAVTHNGLRAAVVADLLAGVGAFDDAEEIARRGASLGDEGSARCREWLDRHAGTTVSG